MSDSKWLESLKPGEHVWVSPNPMYTPAGSIASVEDVTKLYVVVGNTRYRKKDGYEVGGDPWRRQHIEPASAKRLNEVAHFSGVQKLQKLVEGGLKDVPLTHIREAIRLLEPKDQGTQA